MLTPGLSKTIKATIARLGPQASSKQIAQALANLGIDVGETHVRRVKTQMLRDDAKAEWHRAKKPVKDRRKKRPQQRKIPGRRG